MLLLIQIIIQLCVTFVAVLTRLPLLSRSSSTSSTHILAVVVEGVVHRFECAVCPLMMRPSMCSIRLHYHEVAVHSELLDLLISLIRHILVTGQEVVHILLFLLVISQDRSALTIPMVMLNRPILGSNRSGIILLNCCHGVLTALVLDCPHLGWNCLNSL